MSEPAPLVEVLLRQREAWQSGARPLVEDFLRDYPHLAESADAVLDLIYNETVLREERRETVTLEEYLARFPQLEGPLRIQFEVDSALSRDDLSAPRRFAGWLDDAACLQRRRWRDGPAALAGLRAAG